MSALEGMADQHLEWPPPDDAVAVTSSRTDKTRPQVSSTAHGAMLRHKTSAGPI